MEAQHLGQIQIVELAGLRILEGRSLVLPPSKLGPLPGEAVLGQQRHHILRVVKHPRVLPEVLEGGDVSVRGCRGQHPGLGELDLTRPERLPDLRIQRRELEPELDVALGPLDPAGDLGGADALVHQPLVGEALVERVEILAQEVFHQGEGEKLLVVELTDLDGYRPVGRDPALLPEVLQGAEPALAGGDLEMPLAVRSGTHHQCLEESVLLDRRRQVPDALGREIRPRIEGAAVDALERHRAQLGARDLAGRPGRSPGHTGEPHGRAR